MRVLLIEDDLVLGAAVRDQIAADGHSIDWAKRLDPAGEYLDVAAYDLVLLDLMLPDGPGQPFLRALRRSGNVTPVIILTALDQISDRIEGLNAGADDYMVKPFDLSELSARVNAVARRYAGNPNPLITIGDLDIDLAARSVLRGVRRLRLRRGNGFCSRPLCSVPVSFCRRRSWKSGSIPLRAKSRATRSKFMSVGCARSLGGSASRPYAGLAIVWGHHEFVGIASGAFGARAWAWACGALDDHDRDHRRACSA